MAIVKRIKCGNGNCFILQQNNKAILVDTARIKYKDKILEECRKESITLIVLTHGHIDHIQNAAWLSKKLQVPIAMHKSDYELIKNNMAQPLYADSLLGKLILAMSIKSFKQDNVDPFEPSVFLQDRDLLNEYGIDAKVVELPGHTLGSIGLNISGENFIVGDALMNMFYPTKAMLYANKEQLYKSANKISEIKTKIIHFGHGKSVLNRNW